MEGRLERLTSISIICLLFFLFFPLSEWVVLVAFILTDFLLYFIDSKRKMNIYVVLLVLLSVSSYLFYPNIVMIVCMCLGAFLFHTYKIEPGKKLIMATLLLMIHIIKNPSIHLLILLLSLFLSTILLTIVITSRNRLHLSQRLKIIFTLSVAGGFVVVCIPYLTKALRTLFSFGMYGVTNVLSRGFSELYPIMEVDKEKEERLNRLTSSFGENHKVDNFQNQEYALNNYLYLGLIIFVLLIFVMMTIYLIKKRKTMHLELKGRIEGMGNRFNKSIPERNKLSSAKIAPPVNIPVRMLVYKFEKKMKGIYQRKHGESFYEWLNRINSSNQELNSELSRIYEKARYGEKEILKKNVNFFDEGLKQIKKQLRK